MNKILVVDDSLVYRNAVHKALKDQTLAYEFVLLSNGKEACEYVEKYGADISLIIIDIEMPLMDGVKATQEIRKHLKETPIIVFAAPTQVGATKALDAISLGANEFVKKFDLSAQNVDQIKEDLIPKVVSYLEKSSGKGLKSSSATIPKPKVSISNKLLIEDKIRNCSLICIGSSTGGPDVLRKIFGKLTEPLRVPVLLVQHMPPVFTEQLANMCAKLSGQKVYEAKNNQKLEKGCYYIAPGDYHMELKKNGLDYSLVTHQGEKVCSVRPAYDVLLRSLNQFSGSILYIVLTGMGEDGANGIQEMKKSKDVVIVQDKASSVVWGMPGSVHDRGLHDLVASSDDVPHYINLLKMK